MFRSPNRKLDWSKDVKPPGTPSEDYEGRKNLHGFASSTLASDGQNLFGFFGDWGVYAFDLQGETIWRQSVGTKTHVWGSSNSPVLFENLVIINASVESGDLVALDKADGGVVWTASGMDLSWSTPALVKLASGETELVVSVKGAILGFDPRTGKELWTCRGVQDYVCPSIVTNGDVVYAIGGRTNTGIAIRAGGEGDVTQDRKIWEINKGSNVSSPVFADGYLYWANEKLGIAYCIEAETGKVVYETRLQPRPGLIYSSIAEADGKLYIISRQDGTFVLKAGPKFELLAFNKFEGDSSVFNACPVFHDGQLLLRSDKFLYCIDDKK